MKITEKAMIFFGILQLVSCAYFQNSQHTYEQTKACITHCAERFEICTQSCDENDKLCQHKSAARAAMHFTRYQHQQIVTGQVVMNEVPAFQDPLACLKSTCDCDEDKTMCQQQCRGSIFKRLKSATHMN